MTFRKLLFNVHLYLALAAGVFVLILGLTGSIKAFETEIDHLLHWKLSYVTPGCHPKALTELGQAVIRAFPGERPGAYLLPSAPNLSYGVSTRRGLVAVNPYTAEILGVRPGGRDFLGSVHQLHLRLQWQPRRYRQEHRQLGRSGHVVHTDFRAVSLVAAEARQDPPGRRRPRLLVRHSQLRGRLLVSVSAGAHFYRPDGRIRRAHRADVLSPDGFRAQRRAAKARAGPSRSQTHHKRSRSREFGSRNPLGRCSAASRAAIGPLRASQSNITPVLPRTARDYPAIPDFWRIA